MKSHNTVLGFLSALSIASASANEIIIQEIGNGMTNPLVSTSFEVNRELGRAWVAVSVGDGFREGDSSDFRILVPGLLYDAAQGQIRYEDTVCATVKTTKLFKGLNIKPKKACVLGSRVIEKTIDTGFERVKEQRLQILLNVL